MDPNQVQSYYECLQCCDKILALLAKEKDTIRYCFKDEPLQAYLAATDEAIKHTRKIRKALESIQTMQVMEL